MSTTLSTSAAHHIFTEKSTHLPQITNLWSQIIRRLPRYRFDRRRTHVIQLPPDVYIDVYGLPGDAPSDVPMVLSTISRIMRESGLHWCAVGDILLAHYYVPKITGDIEVCVPLEDLPRTQEIFKALTEFCFPFRPGRSYYSRHLAQYPRFRVKGMNQCFFLVPASHYGLNSQAFTDIMKPPRLDFPLLPLPHYVRGLASIAVTHNPDDNNFISQIEFLIDGMDIDEEWCHTYLDGPSLEFVQSRSTRSGKKARMGSHPKYEGNLTTYIRNESERKEAIGVVGRVIEHNGVLPSSPASHDVLSLSSFLPANMDHALPIQIMSDLHLEGTFQCPGGDTLSGYDVFDCKPVSPILALLGDIGLTAQDGLFVFLQRQLSKYEKLFFVMGNHEYYRTSHGAAKARMNHFADEMHKQRALDNSQGEFIFLDRTRYDLTDDVTILGCTLWSHIPPTALEVVGRRLNDFKRIDQWSVETHNSAHFADADWLDGECAKITAEEPGRRIVVFTHYAPAIQGTSTSVHQNSLVNSAFATDMTVRSCWGHPVSLWAFGHTHFNCDFVRGGVRVVSNQRGYEGIEASRSRFLDDLVLYV